MNIAIARLRSQSLYREPLHDQSANDSFYENLRRFIVRHPEHTYRYYNFSFTDTPTRDITAIADADVIVIPSEAEFTYFIPHRFHPKVMARSQQHVDALRPYVVNKPLILLRSDRCDDAHLYRTHTFAGVPLGDIHTIDETEFPAGIHGMRFHFIRGVRTVVDDVPRIYDFAYWGSDKRKTIGGVESGDQRHVMLARVHRDVDLRSVFVGYTRNVKPQHRWTQTIDLVPLLRASRATICYNWFSKTDITARYVEAIACGMIPFVWHEYDIENKLVAYNWQRVQSFDEYKQKLQIGRVHV